MENKAYTLIEMLTAITMFIIVVGAISGLFISAVRSQRRVLATQEVLDQTSYVLEYMGRALRMAKKDTGPTCLTNTGYNYEAITNGIKFIDYQDRCTSYYLDTGTGQLKKIDGVDCTTASPCALTSSKLQVNSFKVTLSGQSDADSLQPRVTIFLEILGRGLTGEQPKIKIQTSISQRNLDS